VVVKLTIALLAASVVLKFTTPGPGTFYVLEGFGLGGPVRIVACGYESVPVHVSYKVPKDKALALYWTYFVEDAP